MITTLTDELLKRMSNSVTVPKATVVVAKVTTVTLSFVATVDGNVNAVVVLTFAADCVSRQGPECKMLYNLSSANKREIVLLVC